MNLEDLNISRWLGISVFVPYIFILLRAVLKIPIKYKYTIGNAFNETMTNSIMKKIGKTYKYSSNHIITTGGIIPNGTVIGLWYVANIKTKVFQGGLQHNIDIYSFTDFDCENIVSTSTAVKTVKKAKTMIYSYQFIVIVLPIIVLTQKL